MEIKGIKYISPLFDGSGYGQASRGYVQALHKSGIPITVSPISFDQQHPELDEAGTMLRSLINLDIEYNIVITHLTAEHYANKDILGEEPGCLKLGYCVWETSKLHPDWPGYINNNLDALMVSSKWSVDVFENSGVTIPVFNVPHGIDMSEYTDVKPFEVKGIDPDAYKFYSIFQFTERKNPVDLIKSYWAAFNNGENVALILKTYRANYVDSEKQSVRETLTKLREVTPIDNRPPIYLILDLLSRKQVLGLHKFGDCFVSLDRGEGFGLGGFEAGATGNPIIVTGWAGATEYAKEFNSYLVNHVLSPVSGMPWSPWYRGDQLWAVPDCSHAIDFMRHAFVNKAEAKLRGSDLQDYIAGNFGWDRIAKRMVEVIESL